MSYLFNFCFIAVLPIEKRFHELARTGNLEEVNRFIKEKNTSRLNVNCMDEVKKEIRKSHL